MSRREFDKILRGLGGGKLSRKEESDAQEYRLSAKSERSSASETTMVSQNEKSPSSCSDSSSKTGLKHLSPSSFSIATEPPNGELVDHGFDDDVISSVSSDVISTSERAQQQFASGPTPRRQDAHGTQIADKIWKLQSEIAQLKEDFHVSRNNERKLTAQIKILNTESCQAQEEIKALRNQNIEWQTKFRDQTANLSLIKNEKNDLQTAFDDIVVVCSGALGVAGNLGLGSLKLKRFLRTQTGTRNSKGSTEKGFDFRETDVFGPGVSKGFV